MNCTPSRRASAARTWLSQPRKRSSVVTRRRCSLQGASPSGNTHQLAVAIRFISLHAGVNRETCNESHKWECHKPLCMEELFARGFETLVPDRPQRETNRAAWQPTWTFEKRLFKH